MALDALAGLELDWLRWIVPSKLTHDNKDVL